MTERRPGDLPLEDTMRLLHQKGEALSWSLVRPETRKCPPPGLT